MELILLIILIILGIYSSITDIFSGKIKNMGVYIGIFLGVVINLFFGYNQNNLLHHIINIIFVILIGFVLWIGNIWSAADGKLYIAFGVLFPFSKISLATDIFLLNIFILSFVFLLLSIIVCLRKKHIIKVFEIEKEKKSSITKLFYSALNLFSLFWLIGLVFSYFNFERGLFLKLLLTFIILSRLDGKKILYFTIPVSFIRFVFDVNVLTLNFWLYFVVMVLLYKVFRSAVRGFLFKLGYIMFTKRVAIGELNKGDVLGDKLVIRENKIKVEPKGLFDFNNFLQEEAEGLTKEQISVLKEKGIRKVRVARTMPFAPLLFLAALVTLFLKQNLLIYVWNLF